MPEPDARPETMDSQKYIVWNQCKLLREANRKSAESADMIMQAIECAPELDLSMQLAFGIRQATPPVKTPVPQPGFEVKPK